MNGLAAQGEVDDFRAFIQYTDNADHKSQRQRWIDALKQWLTDPK